MTTASNQSLIDLLLAQIKVLQDKLAQLITAKGGGGSSSSASSTNTTQSTSTNTTSSTSSASCSWNGATIASGSSVTAYQSSSVSYGSQCASQTRTCSNGTLSGTYTAASCVVGTASSCTWNGSSVANGASVTAYQSSSVASGSQCVSETRTCSNGTLSGSYTNTSCSVQSSQSCTGTWPISANTLQGTLSIPSVQNDGSFSATLQFAGLAANTISGTCSNGSISFYRSIGDQTYSGSYTASSMSGTFTYAGSNYSWSAWVAPTIAACSTNSAQTCAKFTDTSGTSRELFLAEKAYYLVDSVIMGNSFPGYVGDELAYLYVYDAQAYPSLWILDLTKAKVIGWMSPAAGYTIYSTYFAYITDPSGNKYPFIAPGAHYLDGSSLAGVANPGTWTFLCIFDPAYIANPSPSCATGFKPYQSEFTNAGSLSSFRHNGGWVSDVDGDGWGDINLPFLRYVYTISGNTGQQLGLSHIVPGSVWVPPLPADFDSGRLYGSYTEMKDPSGRQSVLISGANGVGTFSDANCNVSCYFLLANWSGGSWTPAWDTFLSFVILYDSYPPYVKKYNLDGCIHRYDNSLEYIGGHPYVVFDYFTEDKPAPVCTYDLSQASPCQTSAITDAIVQQATGFWSVSFLDAWTGVYLTAVANRYVWGRATNVVPNNTNPLLLVQGFTSNSGKVAFGQTASSVDALHVVQLTSAPSWSLVGSVLNPPSAPKLIDRFNYYGAYSVGLGSSNAGMPELNLKDIDGDGLNDVELQNGQWLGWSAAQGKLVIKNATSS